MICSPEAVVMAFPAVWADAFLSATGVTIAAVRLANAVWMMVRREDRIWCTFLVKPLADGSKMARSIAERAAVLAGIGAAGERALVPVDPDRLTAAEGTYDAGGLV